MSHETGSSLFLLTAHRTARPRLRRGVVDTRWAARRGFIGGPRADLFAVAIRQRALKLLSRVKEAAHDGPFGDPHHLGHLFVTQPVDFAHDDDGAVVARQRIERRLEPGADLAPPDDVG